MKRNYIRIMAVLVALGMLASCKKFLDVKPEDKVLEEDTFSTVKGVNTALNGLYINLAKNSLYGDNLTLSTIDILAQRYNVPSSHTLLTLSTYDYATKPAVDKIDAMWSAAYVNILNANVFMANLNKYMGVLDASTDSIYRGEAIAIRAMLHLDLLRLYGPMYNSADSVKESIPYYTQAESSANKYLPANQVMSLILSDLAKAETLLKNDPVIANGVMPTFIDGENNFMRNRNYRLNYYAVKALQARANMYRGNKPAALEAAKVLIQNTAKFPWITLAAAVSEKTNPDRVYTQEMILGIQNSQLYNNYNNYFAPELEDKNILAPVAGRLTTVFETNENDYRYNPQWAVPGNGSKTYRTFYKYADVIDKAKTFRFSIPMIKISEMFYIAAECEPVAATAIGYLNTVRNNRGLLSLAATANLNTELQKEYQKEFFGEGQLFYYYKRRNITSIPNGSAASGNVTMNASKYVLPLPLSETQYRQ
ncbi:RagB/SusD family nutrient uptake outer membrane protein [Pedobacter africanus]|uniref:Starch-binding associating with outer membrane n=1 Tax=Pedobacter africanus TaxID=151894 RepID=A0A1W2AWA1_9SPHI|nr:RagB/SusD family nutrient uptake outer membrane protein [Pedobacter africanus]SMC64830.1 Starch-binding associating with outer membrane [Pedobacter africanus]